MPNISPIQSGRRCNDDWLFRRLQKKKNKFGRKINLANYANMFSRNPEKSGRASFRCAPAGLHLRLKLNDINPAWFLCT